MVCMYYTTSILCMYLTMLGSGIQHSFNGVLYIRMCYTFRCSVHATNRVEEETKTPHTHTHTVHVHDTCIHMYNTLEHPHTLQNPVRSTSGYSETALQWYPISKEVPLCTVLGKKCASRLCAK